MTKDKPITLTTEAGKLKRVRSMTLNEMDCFASGWNLHRARQPMLKEEGYEGSRAGWKERERVVKELGEEPNV